MDSPISTTLANAIVIAIKSQPHPTTEVIREIRRFYSKMIKSLPAEEVIALADTLLNEPDFNPHFVAFELVHYHANSAKSLTHADLERFGRVLNSWYSVDTFAPYLSGVAWRNRQIGDEVIHKWAHSPNRWWRRAALVSTIALNTRARGGTGDVPRTLAVCAILVSDHDDMVEKAMSWALREVIRYDPQAVTNFLATHEAVLGKRILREVRNKLRTGKKNPKLNLTS